MTVPIASESEANVGASPKVFDDELRIHFKNGLPSIVLAIVTVVLSVYSYSVVQPNIQARYREICTTNFNRMELTKMEEKLRLLTDTQLALRRLTLIDSSNESIRFELANVSEAIADWYEVQAYESATRDTQSNDAMQYLAGMQNELRKTTDAMRSIQRLNGDHAILASAWLLKKRLHNSYSLSDEELFELESQTSQTIEKSTSSVSTETPFSDKRFNPANKVLDGSVVNNRERAPMESLSEQGRKKLKWLRGEILAKRALKFSDNESKKPFHPESLAKSTSVSERLELLQAAISNLDVSDSENIETESWTALALVPIEPDKAKELAWGAVQDFWARGTVKYPRSEELDGVVRGLLVGGNLEEAQSFVMNQVKKLPSFAISEFRRLVADSCLRQVVADYLIDQQSRPKKSGLELQTKASFDRITMDFRLLELAVRLQPDLDGLSNILTVIAESDFDELESSLSGYVRRVLEASSNEGFIATIDAVKAVKNRDHDAVRKAIERVCREDLVYSVLATQVASSLSRTNADRKFVIAWLHAINEYSPEALAAWFARGRLHLSLQEKKQAIECFEYLAKRLPENEQVKELLDEARQ